MVEPTPDAVPLNAIRVFIAVARDLSVTQGARTLGITQSAASRHLAVLEHYLGGRLIERRGRRIALTSLGKLFFDTTADHLDSIVFTAQRLRRHSKTADTLTIRTSISALAYSLIIPNLNRFSDQHDGATVDIVTSLATPTTTDRFDVLVTRDLHLSEASDEWKLHDETLACIGLPDLINGRSLAELVRSVPVITFSSRPDVLPFWSTAHGVQLGEILRGPRFDHHFLAIPALKTGQGVVIAPDLYFSDLVLSDELALLPGSHVRSGMTYRAYSIDRSTAPDLTGSFCRWLMRLCRETSALLAEKAAD